MWLPTWWTGTLYGPSHTPPEGWHIHKSVPFLHYPSHIFKPPSPSLGPGSGVLTQAGASPKGLTPARAFPFLVLAKATPYPEVFGLLSTPPAYHCWELKGVPLGYFTP